MKEIHGGGGCCSKHDHKEEKGCGCDGQHHMHDHDHDHGHHHHDHDHKIPAVIYLEMEDGSELACDVLAIFELGDKEYIAVLPQETETAYLYGYTENEEGPALHNIEDDDEYERVSNAFADMIESVEEDEEEEEA